VSLMAVAEFEINDLTEITGFSKQEIIDTLTEIGAPVEEGEDGKLVVEVTPNRPDLFFIEGIARTLKAYLKKEKSNYVLQKSNYALMCDRSVLNVRPFIRIAVVTGVKMDEKGIEYLINAQEKMHDTVGRKRRKIAIGIHNLDVIEFPLIYRAVDDIRFVPLDYNEEMSAKEILVKHPKGVEYSHLVKDKLPMIFDKKGVISFPPIINSERTRLSGETTNFLIDVTGLHKGTVDGMLNNVVCALVDRGGTAFDVKINGEISTLNPQKMPFDIKFFSKILGMKLKKEQVADLLSKMDYEVKGNNVLVPPYRMDVMHEVDVLEDVAIAYGFNNFKPTLPDFFTPGKLAETHYEMETIMRGMGFSEIKTFTLTSKKLIEEMDFECDTIPVINPATEEYNVLRPSLCPSMIEVFILNKTKGLPQKLFELGQRCKEKKMDNALIFGVMDKKVEFSDVRGYLQTLMNEQNKEFELKKSHENDCFDNSRSGEIYVNNYKIGKIGKIKKELLDKYGLEFEIYLCEILV
jgi:phenylalanyl-tRNA synthetase beta chain